MENEKEALIEFAVKLLNRTDPTEVENVNVDVTEYENGSTLQVTVEFPATGVTEDVDVESEEECEFDECE